MFHVLQGGRLMKKMKLLGIATGAAVVLSTHVGHASLPLASQDFATDPLWAAANNTTAPHSFGFTNSSHITGASAGEAGGLIGDGNVVAYYADLIGGNLTFATNFQASGKLTMDTFNGFSNPIQVGYFNKDDTDAPVFIGLQFLDLNSSLARVRLCLQRAPGDDRTSTTEFIEVGRDYDWSFSYDPTGGAGLGTISASFTGIDSSTNFNLTMNLGGGDKTDPDHVFNAFGLVSPKGAAGAGNSTLFLDNLQYSVFYEIPEPTALAMVSAAAMFLLLRRRCSHGR